MITCLARHPWHPDQAANLLSHGDIRHDAGGLGDWSECHCVVASYASAVLFSVLGPSIELTGSHDRRSDR